MDGNATLVADPPRALISMPWLGDHVAMSSSSRIKVDPSVAHSELALKDLTIAWALDAAALRPIHILELGKDRSGSRANCICPSCGASLVAVNNAKPTYHKRPHFRHVAGAGAEGTGLTGCAIVAARVAILRALETRGWIDLPGRTRPGQALGYLGQVHTGSASRPPERVQLKSATLIDRTRAVLTLADGRQIDVILSGSGDFSTNTNEVNAVVTIEVKDPELATLDAEQLRDRLALKEAMCWQQHWDDDALDAEASKDALQIAREHLSVAPQELELPDDMPPELKTETVLHYAVKQILANGGTFTAPGKHFVAKASSYDLVHERSWQLHPQRLVLTNVELERRLGLIRPDLVCTAHHLDGGDAFESLCIEVTVTNGIGEERVERIRQVGLPTIEINLRGLAGRITRSELVGLIEHGEHLKSWVFHPEFRSVEVRLQTEVEDEKRAYDKALQERRKRLSQVLRTPLEEVVAQFFAAVIPYLEFVRDNRGPFLRTDSRYLQYDEIKQPVLRAADALRMKDIPGADDELFLDGRGVLAELLSIKENKVLVEGLQPGPGFAVLESTFRSPSGIRSVNFPLLLGAARVYELPMEASQEAVFGQWRDEVREIFANGPLTYPRSERFDRLLGALFPELSKQLLKTAAHFRAMKARGVSTTGEKLQVKTPSLPQSKQERERLLDTRPWDLMLKGRDLERWIRENPDSAKGLGLKPPG